MPAGPPTATAPKPAVAIVAPFTGFWQAASPTDLRERLERLVDDARERIGAHATVVEAAIVGSREEGAAAAERIRAAGVRLDAIVVLQAMAVMPAFTLAAVEPFADVPLIVWAAQTQRRLSDAFDHATITQEGSTVGVPMLTSPLVRRARPFELVVGLTDDEAVHRRLAALVRAAAAAQRVRHGRVGLVGERLDGYDCVAIDPASLRERIGTEVVAIDPGELVERWRAVDPARIAAVREETAAAYAIDPALGPEQLERTLRAACALEDLVAAHRLDAGALNCHLPEIRPGEIGIAPCFGLGRLTSAGIPWCCTGDVPTAVAMLLLKALGAAATYHELEAFDAGSGEFVIANTGEHDLAFGDGATPRLAPNLWFAGDAVCGGCVSQCAPAGPATLLGFVELDAPTRVYRLVVAPGSFTARRFEHVGTSSAAYVFGSGPAPEAWERWCRAGVSHHSAATPGDWTVELAAAGRFLGVEVVVV